MADMVQYCITCKSSDNCLSLNDEAIYDIMREKGRHDLSVFMWTFADQNVVATPKQLAVYNIREHLLLGTKNKTLYT